MVHLGSSKLLASLMPVFSTTYPSLGFPGNRITWLLEHLPVAASTSTHLRGRQQGRRAHVHARGGRSPPHTLRRSRRTPKAVLLARSPTRGRPNSPVTAVAGRRGAERRREVGRRPGRDRSTRKQSIGGHPIINEMRWDEMSTARRTAADWSIDRGRAWAFFDRTRR